LAFFETMANPHFVATTAANLAEASYELGDYEAAQRYAYLVLDQEEPYAYPYAHYTLGLLRRAAGALTAAEEHLLESARFAQRSEDQYMEAYARRALGELYREMGRHAESTAAHVQATALATRLGITV
jgi:tetratricopeptide (TPR) repeat protein